MLHLARKGELITSRVSLAIGPTIQLNGYYSCRPTLKAQRIFERQSAAMETAFRTIYDQACGTHTEELLAIAYWEDLRTLLLGEVEITALEASDVSYNHCEFVLNASFNQKAHLKFPLRRLDKRRAYRDLISTWGLSPDDL
jgi:hypothetical protein